MRTIGIVGGTIWGNRGAEAMLVTSIGKVRESFPEAKFSVFSYYPEKDEDLIQDKTITVLDSTPMRLAFQYLPFALLFWLLKKIGVKLPAKFLPQSISVLSSCDLVLDISGIAFSDKREIYLPFNILIIWPAMLLGVPVVKLSQALGPFKNPLNRLLAKMFLQACTLVFGRGQTTGLYLDTLGIAKAKWRVAPDIAFLFKSEFSLSRENAEKVENLKKKLETLKKKNVRVIGLSPSAVVYNKSKKAGRDYLLVFIELMQQLGTNYNYVFVPNATREGHTSSRNNDIFLIDQIQHLAKSAFSKDIYQRIDFVNYDINTDESRSILEHCDLVVSSRFHGMISSLCLEIPVIVIGWGHKYSEVLTEFGLKEFAADFSSSQFDLVKTIEALSEREKEIRQKLFRGLINAKTNSAVQFNEVRRLLL